jgi:hypothetical protein
MQESNEMTRLLVTLVWPFQIGNPIGHRNLTLVPLFGKTAPLDYILAAEAIQAGQLTVKEVSDAGNVNVLLVENKSAKRVLLLDGEELVGAKQNRILNTTILIEANTTQKIPVSCVEAGRWRHVSSHFSTGAYAASRVRANMSKQVNKSYAQSGQAKSDQAEVWQDVDKLLFEMKVAAPTRAMRDAFEHRAADFDGYVKALPYPDGACGVIAAVSGDFAAMDVLGRPEVFSSIWTRLITGYAADAVCRKDAEHKPFGEKQAASVIEKLSECRASEFQAAGLGKELRIESDVVVGKMLLMDQVLVHLSLFPNQPSPRDTDHAGGHIMPPSFRQRSRRGGV